MKKEKLSKPITNKPSFVLTNKTAIIVILVLPILYFLIFTPSLLTGAKMMFGTDWLNGGYAAREIITKDLSQYKSMPLWYNYVFSGLPTVASPFGDAASLYPFIRLVIPTHILWTYIFVFGFMIAGIGMYLYLKSIDISNYAALVGSIAYMFAGNLASMTFAGHEGRLLAAAFFPLAFFFFNKGISTKKFFWFVFAGGVAGFSFLHGHFELTYFGLLFALSYLVVQLILDRKQNKIRNSLKIISYSFISVLIALGMYMVNFLPFYGNLSSTARSDISFQTYQWSSSYPLPFKEVFELIVPQFSGAPNNYWGSNSLKLHAEYFGIILIILAVFTLFIKIRERRTRFFLGASIVGTLIALGGQTPFFKLAYLLPGMKRFRGPSMVFYLVAFSAITIGTIGLQTLIEYNQQRKPYDQHVKKKFRSSIYVTLAIFLLTIIVFKMSKGNGGNTNYIENISSFWFGIRGLLISVLIALVGMFLFNQLANRKIKLTSFLIILIPLILFDQWRVGSKFLKTEDTPSVYYAQDEVINYLKSDSSMFRVYPLYYERSNDGLLDLNHIQSLSGQGPNPLRSYQEFLGAEKTVSFQGPNLIYPNFLNLLNAKYIISVPLPEDISRYDARTQAMIVNMKNFVNNPGLELAFSGRKYLIYKNNNVLPRAFLVNNYIVIKNKEQIITTLQDVNFDPKKYVILSESIPGFVLNDPESLVGMAKINYYSPNRIMIETEQNKSGFLVVSENYHPDWCCKVDGKLTKVYPAYHTLRAVYLKSGNHKVEFFNYSKLYIEGRILTVISTLFCIGVIVVVLYRRKREKKVV